jgi:hypothetical protein
VTTGVVWEPEEPLLGTLVEVPLVAVVTGEYPEEEDVVEPEPAEPVEELPVVALAPLYPELPTAAPEELHAPGPAAPGSFGFMCLVTRIVRWITLVLTNGLAATDAAF